MVAKILWFTGLSGSGKTTLANLLKKDFEEKGKKVKIIDGDDVRRELHKHLGFSPEDIKENNRLILEICELEKEEYDYILVPIISPFREDRLKARKRLGKDFIEVYLKCSLDHCIKKDVKGHYKKALSGEIKNFIGVAKENPYEEPENPEITLNTEKEDVAESISKIKNYLKRKK